MKKCKLCDNEINDDKILCKKCMHDKRNLKYLLHKFEELFDEIFIPREPVKERESVIAS